jgi:tetratricopeptide (TPR) repeat protein
MADMNTLEQAGGAEASRTQLYLSLGRLLEKEMDALRERGDSAGLERTRQAYQRFLAALAGSKSGQTYESLEWAGESMLKLGNPTEAGEIFERVVKTYENDAAFQARPGSGDLLLRARLKLAAALREQRKFPEAARLIDQLIKENPRLIEPKFEEAMLTEDMAQAVSDPRKMKLAWAEAFAKWRKLAQALSRVRTKPVAYYDAWYHAALALKEEGKAAEAKQTLNSVMRLSPAVGAPEMKAKYNELLRQIK